MLLSIVSALVVVQLLWGLKLIVCRLSRHDTRALLLAQLQYQWPNVVSQSGLAKVPDKTNLLSVSQGRHVLGDQ